MGWLIAGVVASIIGTLVSAGTGIYNAVTSSQENQQNISAQEKMNADNISMQRETNALNEQLMRESWQRDDTAIQRSKADALAAGFSPLAGLGGAANSGPITLSAPQTSPVISSMNRSGLNQIADTGKSLGSLGQQLSNLPGQREQIEQAQLNNDLLRDQVTYSKIKILKEFDNLDLQNTKLQREIESMIGDSLARGILSEDDLKGSKWEYVSASNRYDKEDQLRSDSNANTARSNEIQAWKESNRHEEWQSEFNSTTETREQEQEIKFSYFGQEVKLRYKETSSGQYIPLSAGIPSNEDPYKSVGYGEPAAVLNELGDGYYFAGWTSDGLPVLSHNIPTIGKPQFLAIVPKGKGSQLYKIESKFVTPGSFDGWRSRYGSDYGTLLTRLRESKSF